MWTEAAEAISFEDQQINCFWRISQKPCKVNIFNRKKQQQNSTRMVWEANLRLPNVKYELGVDRQVLWFDKVKWKSIITDGSHPQIEAPIVLSFESGRCHNWWSSHGYNRPGWFSRTVMTAVAFFSVGFIAAVRSGRWFLRPWRRCWLLCCRSFKKSFESKFWPISFDCVCSSTRVCISWSLMW